MTKKVSQTHHPDASVISLQSQADVDAASVMARELCGLVGVRNYAAQTIVSTVGELATKVHGSDGGQLTLRVDPDSSRLIITATVSGPDGSQGELRGLAKLAHRVECDSDGDQHHLVASFDYERLRQ